MSNNTIGCYFCSHVLIPENNHMTAALSGLPYPPPEFGWNTVIVVPFREVPCCDICSEREDLRVQ